jgi:pyrroline-5-carboxylate reductase
MIPSRPRVLLLGAGRMGGALLDGWLTQNALQGPPTVLEPTPTAALKARANGGEVRLNPQAGANAPDIAVVAVKPQSFAAGLAALKPFLSPKTVILSVAAGRSVKAIAAQLGEDRVVVRAMPNTPAAIGKGITVVYAPPGLDPGVKQQCTALLTAAGEVVYIDDEAKMDAVTAVSGSGPAYVFHLVECLAAAGVAEGLDPELAMRLARATVAGSGALLTHRSESAATLRAEVTSPGGTTEAALRVLTAENALATLFRDAVAAATARGRMLGSG